MRPSDCEYAGCGVGRRAGATMCAARVRVHVRVGACVFVLVVWQGRASACVLICVVGGVQRDGYRVIDACVIHGAIAEGARYYCKQFIMNCGVHATQGGAIFMRGGKLELHHSMLTHNQAVARTTHPGPLARVA